MHVTNPIVQQLLVKYKEISMLAQINALLGWDLNVNLPPKASAGRAEQSAYLTELITNKWLDTTFRSLLEKAQGEKTLTADEQAIVRNLKIGSKYFYQVPQKTIIKKEQVTAAAFVDWRQAREENNFKKFLPHLTEIIALNREIASHLGYKDNPYDALLDMYEPELTAKECERLFIGMKKSLVPLIKKITTSRTYIDSLPFLNKTIQYPLSDQEKLLTHMVSLMGFDFSSGKINVSPHPFTIQLGSHDIRLTTMYNLTDFRESFTSSTHEAGHGLYEQGINPEYMHTPLGGGVSLGIHEALSRFWENMVGKNPIFLLSIAPLFRAFYSEQLRNTDDQSLVRSFNLVKPSLIRIHADEVTYSLHIILRFEMENALINGKLSAKDAAEAWREKAEKLLGVTPTTDSEGVLQDVHWTYGSFGYFPSYALGNLYGAQFLHNMRKEIAFDQSLQQVQLLPIKEWLDKNIHTYGSLYLPKDLIKKVTGKPLDYTYFIDYLTEKYSALYQLPNSA